MTDDSEWSDWHQHDGNGCPCKGMWTHVQFAYGPDGEGIAGTQGDCSWLWPSWYVPIIRYRIRKPKALRDMQDRARELDGPALTPASV